MNQGGISRYDVDGCVKGDIVVLSPLQLPLTLIGKGNRDTLKMNSLLESHCLLNCDREQNVFTR